MEEYCNHDLTEYYVTTHSEELHCVVSPDFLRKHIVDDIPNDPYCTPGFITAFRMLSPQYEPAFGAPARTMSGALAEMERLIGDALYSGYVGYNGRAPGVAVRKEESGKDSQERRREGGDARHILVAYFEIKELASILGVDWQTSNLATRIFRFTASNTSLRNRSVESLATAAFVAAVQRRCREHDDPGNGAAPESSIANNEPDWLMKLKSLTVRDIAHAANIDESEVHRNLKVVNVALRKQRPDSYESIVAQMPLVCNQLQLEEQTRRLAVDIAERAIRLNICSRRAPASVSAACIYMACQLDGVRKTQAEVCRATTVTEVTLRKVHKELIKEEMAVVPSWFSSLKRSTANGTGSSVQSSPVKVTDARSQIIGAEKQGGMTSEGTTSEARTQLLPPPLPPGFGQSATLRPDAANVAINSKPRTAQQSGPTSSAVGSSPQVNSTSDPAVLSAAQPAVSDLSTTGTTTTPGMPNPAAMLDPAVANMMMTMMQNPAALQAIANAMAMMPHMMPMMPPPPPPPLPPRLPTSQPVNRKEGDKPAQSDAKATPPSPPIKQPSPRN